MEYLLSKRRPEAPLHLWQDIYSEDPNISSTAKDELADHYRYLVEAIARKLKSKLPTFIHDDDLLSSANYGFVRAMNKYTPESGPFSRYASVVIWGAVIDGLRAIDFAPKGLRKKERDLNSAIQSLQDEGLEDITDEDVSDRLEISVEELNILKRKIIRSDVKTFDPLSMPIKVEAGIDDFSTQMTRVFCSWLQKKPAITQQIMIMKYWRGDTYKTISTALGIPSSEVRAIQYATLEELLPLMQQVASD